MDRLVVDAVAKAYPGHQVLDGLSLAVAAGAVVAICGASGTGKSTLLNCIGLLDRPDAGTISIDGQRVDHLPAARRSEVRARQLGFVFQGFHLLPEFSVIENIVMPARCAGLAAADHQARAEALLERCGLGSHRRAAVDTLSGGERQRVALCRALLLQPPLILADEPTGNLDPATGRLVFDLLVEMAEGEGSSVVVVTHDHDLAERCHRSLTLDQGRLHAH